jgi:hypothetical protein
MLSKMNLIFKIMENYKKIIFLFLVTVFGGNSVAIGQVKIGGNPSVINVNSALEIEASDKGLLLPRIALVSTTSASPLTSAIVAGMTVYNTATIADVTPGFYYYNGIKWIRVADAAAGTVAASNGLSVNGGTVKLGGALISPTIIGTDAANTFALAGLQTGLVTDDVLLSNGGVVKKIGAASFLNGATTVSNTSSANNLSTTVNGKTGTVVPMINSNALSSSANTLTSTVNGIVGTTAPIINSNALSSSVNTLTSSVNGIIGTTAPIVNSNTLSVTGSNLTSTVNGVSSTPIDLTSAIANGTTVSNTSSANNLSTTVNGKTGIVVPIINSNALSSSANTLTSTVNGIAGTTAPIINSNALSSSVNTLTSTVNGIVGTTAAIINSNLLTNTNGNLVSTVNGVAAPGVPVLATSSNGLTTTNGDVKLGGALTGATIMTTDVTNTLALAGLQLGTGTDDLITAKSDGVLRRTPMSVLSSNIYNSNGSLTENREVQQGDYHLRFNSTKSSVLIDNKNGSNISLYTFDSNGRSNISLAAGSTNLYTYVDGGNSANISSSGAPMFTIGTADAARINFMTNNTRRIVVTETGQVGIGTESPNNTLEIFSPANDASGLRFSHLKSTSPESVGGAIGVDANGDVVRVPALTTSSNGLTTTSGDVKLGGTLTSPTTITQGTNSLLFEGTAGTGGSTTFDNSSGSSVSILAKAANGTANLRLGTSSVSLDSSVNGGGAQITASGSTGFSIGTSNLARLGFNTNNQERMSISPSGKVLVENNMVIYSTNGGAGTSGLQFYELRSSSPESVGGAIGVDQNGNVVRIASANNPFSNKLGSPIVIGATGTAPAKAAAENDFIRYRELGNNQVEIDFLYSTTGTGTADGTGDYLFTLPNGYSFNGGENPVFTNPITTAAEVNTALPYALRDVKTAFVGSAGVSTVAYVIPYDATHFRLVSISTNKAVGDTSNQLTNATVVYGGRFVFVK